MTTKLPSLPLMMISAAILLFAGCGGKGGAARNAQGCLIRGAALKQAAKTCFHGRLGDLGGSAIHRVKGT